MPWIANAKGGEARFVPDWMEEYFPRLTELGADVSSVHGCGCYGCVFPSKADERWVFKLSNDPKERGAWEWIHKQQKQGVPGMDAFVFVSHVEKLSGSRVLVKREEIDLSERPTHEQERYFGILQATGRNYSSYRRMSRNSDDPDRFSSDVEAQAERYESAARALARFDGFGVMSRGLIKSAEFGVYFGDLHDGNVGRTVVNWGKGIRRPGTWVVFDPGVTSIDESCPTHGRSKEGSISIPRKGRVARVKSPKRSRRGWM